MVNSKIHTFRTERDTGIHRLNTSTIVNVDNDSGLGDTLWQVDNLVGVTRYTTVQEAITNGNLVPISGSGGGSALCVSDEGTVVNNDVCCINFVGVDVLANQDPTNPCQVNVYIPTPAYPSHYSTVDGNTNGTVPDVATSNRYISLPSAPRGSHPGEFNTDTWSSDLIARPCTRDSTLDYNNSQNILLEDELSTLNVEVIDADDATVIHSLLIGPINANSVSSVGGINVNITNYGPSSDKFQCKISVNIDLGTIVPNSGKVTLRITHNTGGTDYVKGQTLFFDSESNTAVLTGVTIQENNATRVIKYLSGIKFYDLGSPFIIDIADIDYLNGDSHPRNKVLLTATNMGLTSYYLHSGLSNNITGWVNDWDDIDDSHHNDNWQITSNNFCFVGDGVANANTIDWSSGPLVPSNNYPVLINTWTSQSDELSEYFLDEDYRLMQDFSTSWDSTQSLITYDTGDNSVQTICGRIKVPGSLSATNANNPDFSTRNPLANPDYTGLTGKRYYRKFTDVTNSVRGSFTMDIQGFTLNDLETNKIEIWIQIPGRMNTPCPVHSSSTFNFGTFDADLSTGSNGPHPTGGSGLHYDDAMRVSSSTANSINVSFGTYGLDATHNSFNMELIINDDSIEPSEIIISW